MKKKPSDIKTSRAFSTARREKLLNREGVSVPSDPAQEPGRCLAPQASVPQLHPSLWEVMVVQVPSWHSYKQRVLLDFQELVSSVLQNSLQADSNTFLGATQPNLAPAECSCLAPSPKQLGYSLLPRVLHWS